MPGVRCFAVRSKQMNILGYRVSDQNGLSFELVFDGKPLSELIGARDTPIPFWLFKKGMTDLPPYAPERGDEVRVVPCARVASMVVVVACAVSCVRMILSCFVTSRGI